MARWDVFNVVAQALGDTVPDRARIASVEVSEDSSVVVLRTLTPALVIGRRGSTADDIRDAISAALGSPVQLRIVEVEDPPEEPPLGGVREPRLPGPNTPPMREHQPLEEQPPVT